MENYAIRPAEGRDLSEILKLLKSLKEKMIKGLQLFSLKN